MNDIENITLSNISAGVADELFEREFEKVLDNIADINTSATVEREIKITVKIKPNEDREHGTITIQTASKLAPVKEHSDPIFFSHIGGKRVAYQARKPIQESIFDHANVKSIAK